MIVGEVLSGSNTVTSLPVTGITGLSFISTIVSSVRLMYAVTDVRPISNLFSSLRSSDVKLNITTVLGSSVISTPPCSAWTAPSLSVEF